jgi:hypothetical protein
MLSDNKVFLAAGGLLGGLGILSFATFVFLKVVTGHSLDLYYTARLIPVTYVAAFATILITVALLLFIAALRFITWSRQRRGASTLDRDT